MGRESRPPRPCVTEGVRFDRTRPIPKIARWKSLATRDEFPSTLSEESETDLRASYERMRLAYELMRAIAHETDLQVMLTKVVDTVVNGFRAERGAIVLVDDDGNPVHKVARRRHGSQGTLELSWTVVEEVMRRRSGVLSADALADSRFETSKSVRMGRVRSTLCVPIVSKDKLHGVLYVDSPDSGIFRPRDLEILNSLASQAALSILDAENQRRLEEMRTRQHTRLEQIVGSMPEAVLLLGTEGDVLLANPAARDMLAVLVGEESPARIQNLRELSIDDIVVKNGETAEISTDGLQPRCFQVRGMTLEASAERLVLIHDRTGMLVQEAKSEQTERLATLGLLAAGVSHDIKNPLNVILHTVEGILSEIQDHRGRIPEMLYEEISDMLGMTREGADRVRSIAQSLERFSRRDTGDDHLVDINELVESSLRIGGAVLKTARIRRDLNDTPQVMANSTRLGQVILNLLVNAAHAVATVEPRRRMITVRTNQGSAGEVVLTIEDQGPGIPEEIRERIFDPFFTTKDDEKGTGLGLYICNGIVGSFGGRISVQSSARGSVFTVYLPAALPELAANDLEVETPRVDAPARILVVDDEPVVRRTVARILKAYAVSSAENGNVALDMCRREQFDAIVCDIHMGESSGIDFHRRLRAENPALASRIVFVSGATFRSEVREFLDQHANLWLEKPLNPKDVRDAVKRILDADDRELRPTGSTHQR